jgi:hypothetical protein
VGQVARQERREGCASHDVAGELDQCGRIGIGVLDRGQQRQWTVVFVSHVQLHDRGPLLKNREREIREWAVVGTSS